MTPLWARVGALAVPALFVFLSFSMWLDSMHFLRGSLVTEAAIVSARVDESRTKRGNGRVETVTSDWPTLRFTTAAGDGIVAESADAMAAPAPRPADRIPVRDFAANSEWVTPYHWIWSVWSGPFIVMGVGI